MKIMVLTSYLLAITNLFGLKYCGHNINMLKRTELMTIKIEDEIIKQDTDYLKEYIKYPVIVGGKNKKNIKLINSNIKDEFKARILDGENTAKYYFGDNSNIRPRFPFEINLNYTVSTDNDKILSFYEDYYEYLGGAHGLSVKKSYTIDKNKETLLKLKDLFKSNYDYESVINDVIQKKIDENSEYYFKGSDGFKGIDDNQDFYIDNDDLVIYYQLYDIAPYYLGIPQFKIPLNVFGNNYIYN